MLITANIYKAFSVNQALCQELLRLSHSMVSIINICPSYLNSTKLGHYSVMRAFVDTKIIKITSHNQPVYIQKGRLRQRHKHLEWLVHERLKVLWERKKRRNYFSRSMGVVRTPSGKR